MTQRWTCKLLCCSMLAVPPALQAQALPPDLPANALPPKGSSSAADLSTNTGLSLRLSTRWTVPQLAVPAPTSAAAPALTLQWSLAMAAPTDLGPPPVKVAIPSSPGYEDRLINNGDLKPLPVDSDDEGYRADGWQRSWHMDLYSGSFNQGNGASHQYGLNASGQIDTPNYGALSFDTTMSADPNSSSLSLWQHGMAFDHGWTANNGVGVINSLGIDLSRSQFRFFLPTFPFSGATTEWKQNSNLQLQASVGVPGQYNGLLVNGFSSLGGSLASAGAQWAPLPHWTGGIELVSASGVQSSAVSTAPDATVTAQSTYASGAWQNDGTRLQGNWLNSQVDGSSAHAGWWLDGQNSQGRYRQNFGVFRLDPDLVWGYIPITSDIQGGYYRINYQSQQWLWDAGFDRVLSVSGTGPNGWYGNASARYQLDHSTGIGGGSTVRNAQGQQTDNYLFADKHTSWGTSRVQFDVAAQGQGQRSQEITYDQTWPMQVGSRLSTSLSLARDAAANSPSVIDRSIAIYGGQDLGNKFSLEANLRWSSDLGGVSSIGRYADLSMNWHMTSHWSLVATYYNSLSAQIDQPAVAPLIPTLAAVATPRDRAFYLTLRYQDKAGSPSAPLGGTVGSSAGSVTGYVYIDSNYNNVRDADEAGVANLTVILDGRFTVRTDNNGRFEFPFVASGTHTLVVMPDNLPLPYMLSEDGKREVMVHTRETSTIDIAVTRLK